MPDMTPEEINKLCAEWAGIEPTRMCGDDSGLDQDCLDGSHDPSECGFLRDGGKWEDCSEKKLVYPDYYHSNAAMDLLVVLVEKGYNLTMEYCDKEWSCAIRRPHMNTPRFFGKAPTIPEAICNAILKLKEREEDVK